MRSRTSRVRMRHAARCDGHAQPVGGQQEARLMAVDVGAFHLGREVFRPLAGLERQHQPDLVRQLRRGRDEIAGGERDPGVAQRHDGPARRLEALAHVVQLGIEGAVAADQDRCGGPLRAHPLDRLVALAGHADQDFGAGARELRQPPDIGFGGVMGAGQGRHDAEIGRLVPRRRRGSPPQGQCGAHPLDEHGDRPPAEPDPEQDADGHLSSLAR